LTDHWGLTELAKRRIPQQYRRALKQLGKKLKKVILKDRKYSSLDAFHLENHDVIAKPTLYDLCEGRRDMRLSTLFGLCRALEISPYDLLGDIDFETPDSVKSPKKKFATYE
jgi:DNA-binding Xre family transcriptional regulator